MTNPVPKLIYETIVAEDAHEREFDLLYNEFGSDFIEEMFQFYEEKLCEEVTCENDNFIERKHALEWAKDKLCLAALGYKNIDEVRLKLFDALCDALGIYLGSEFAGRYRDFLMEHQDDY